jgi:uncharacterized membrane protein
MLREIVEITIIIVIGTIISITIATFSSAVIDNQARIRELEQKMKMLDNNVNPH